MGAGGENGGETGAADRGNKSFEGPFRRGEHSLGTQIPDNGLRR